MKSVLRYQLRKLGKATAFLAAVLLVVFGVLAGIEGVGFLLGAGLALGGALLYGLGRLLYVAAEHRRLKAMVVSQQLFEDDLEREFEAATAGTSPGLFGTGEVTLCGNWFVYGGSIALRRENILGIRLVRTVARRRRPARPPRYVWEITCFGAPKHTYRFTSETYFSDEGFKSWLKKDTAG